MFPTVSKHPVIRAYQCGKCKTLSKSKRKGKDCLMGGSHEETEVRITNSKFEEFKKASNTIKQQSQVHQCLHGGNCNVTEQDWSSMKKHLELQHHLKEFTKKTAQKDGFFKMSFNQELYKSGSSKLSLTTAPTTIQRAPSGTPSSSSSAAASSSSSTPRSLSSKARGKVH